MITAPALPDALCAGRWPMWDDHVHGESDVERTARHAAAIAVCGRCPEIEPCRALGASLPRARYGVWSGRLHVERPRARRNTGAERRPAGRARPVEDDGTPDDRTAA